jgi:hypothetical protein
LDDGDTLDDLDDGDTLGDLDVGTGGLDKLTSLKNNVDQSTPKTRDPSAPTKIPTVLPERAVPV